jgi:hypothetical protein
MYPACRKVTNIELQYAVPGCSLSWPKGAQWVLVVETSFILSHLQLVDNLVKFYKRLGTVVMLPAATMQELHWLEKSDSMIRHKNANGVDMTLSVGALARRAKSWSMDTKDKKDKKNERVTKVLWDKIREEVMGPTGDVDSASLHCCRYVNEVKGMRTALLSNDKKLCLKALSYGGWLLSRLMSIY